MFITIIAALMIAMFIALIRTFVGPTIYDRILAVNLFGTQTVLFIAVLGFAMGRPEFLDIAIIYALINFIAVIGILRFFEYANVNQDKEETK